MNENLKLAPETDAEQLIELGVNLAKSFYKAHPYGQGPTMVHGVKNGEIVFSARLTITDQITKMLSIAAANKALKEQGCDASISTFEAWTSRSAGRDRRPSECPDREELLVVVVSAPDRYVAEELGMMRNDEGRLTGFSEHGRYDSAKSERVMESRFDFFDALQGRARIGDERKRATKH